ncbi:MAG: methionyl-tRNA formyltransferase [Nitrospinota bacterium]
MKIIFMGTPDFAIPTLKSLIESRYNVVCVVTRPDRPKGRGRGLTPPPVKIAADSWGMPILQPESVKNNGFTDKLKGFKPDIIVVVAFGQILTGEILNIPIYGCINLHASLLPKYRGAAPINRAIINGEKITGITTMQMDKGMDTGDILLKREVEISSLDDAVTLHDRLSEIGAGAIIETLEMIELRTLCPISQDYEHASYAPKLKKEDGLIDWGKDSSGIYNLVRGVIPWPGAYTYHGEAKLKIWKVDSREGKESGKGGEIMDIRSDGIEVAAGKGSVIIKEIQPEGKKRMKAEEYIRGYKIEVGEVFMSIGRQKGG